MCDLLARTLKHQPLELVPEEAQRWTAFLGGGYRLDSGKVKSTQVPDTNRPPNTGQNPDREPNLSGQALMHELLARTLKKASNTSC